MPVHSVGPSCSHCFPLYFWLNSAENLPFPNQLLSYFYFPRWANEINEGDWQKHAWGLAHNSMDPVSGYITGNICITSSNSRHSLQGQKQLGKKNIIGVSVWETFSFLSAILHQSDGAGILNGPLGLSGKWLTLINCTRNKGFLFRMSPGLLLVPSSCDFLFRNPEEHRIEVFMSNRWEHSFQQGEWTLAKENTAPTYLLGRFCTIF